MNIFKPSLLLVLAGFLVFDSPVPAQDNSTGGEPIIAMPEHAALTYEYLVDDALAQDDPANKAFKTLQAAYEAAPEGTATKSTVIGIKPNVYQLPGGDTGASLNITKNYITLLGLTTNRRAVVLADNRGHAQGATDNGYVLVVNATGFTARNLTILNYCNVDYEYPGDATKNLSKRSDVITQAVALQASGDKHVYENVALLSRLDTMFLRTARSYFKNVFIEGTDDFIGGGQLSVWEDCTVTFPMGRGVMSASQIAFLRCRFEAMRGMQFYKSEFGSGARPVALIRLRDAGVDSASARRMDTGQSRTKAQFVLPHLSREGRERQTGRDLRQFTRYDALRLHARAVGSGSAGFQSLEHSASNAERRGRRLGSRRGEGEIRSIGTRQRGVPNGIDRFSRFDPDRRSGRDPWRFGVAGESCGQDDQMVE